MGTVHMHSETISTMATNFNGTRLGETHRDSQRLREIGGDSETQGETHRDWERFRETGRLTERLGETHRDLERLRETRRD